MSSSATAGVAPPVARRSEEGSDPYHWLRTTDPSGAVSEDSEIYSYLKAENAYTEAMTSNLQPLQDVIFAEFKKRIRENDQTPPARDGPYSYYFKYQEGKQYKIYCRSSSHFPPPSSTSPSSSSSSSSSSSTSSTSSTSSSSSSPSIYSDDLIKHLPFQRFDGTGRVFGGARPTGEQVEKYVTELNISTIVTLLEDSEMTEELHAAYGKLQHEGRAKQLRLPLRAGQAPENKRATQELLREIGAQLREGRHVWVHCSDGTQRTGLLLALLGITIDQQPLDQVGPWLQSHLPAAGHALGGYADFLASFPIEQEEIVLDVNALAADGGHEFIDVRAVSYSPDHRKIVFSQDTSGSESYLLFIKDLASGRIYSEEAIPGADGGNLEWSNDSTKLFYTLLDEQNQPNRVLCHTLGQPVADDVLFWQEHNQEFYVTLSKTRSNAFIVISTSSAETSESWLIDADSASLASLRLVQPRQEGLLYDVTHHPNPWPQSQLEPAQQQATSNPSTLLVLTNAHSAVDFQLMWCPVDHTTIEHWRPLLPHKPARRLLCISSFRNHLVLRVRENAIMQVQILPLPLPAALRLTSASSSHDAGVEATAEAVLPTIQTIEWGSEIYKCTLGTNHEFDTEWLQVLFKTPITPNQYFEVKLSDPSSRWVIKTDDLPCGYDSSRYEAKRLWVPSSRDEGVLIPVSIMQPKHRGPGPHPCILYGYGSYEISIDAEFDRKWLSFFDRGYTFAIAHVRGGGEMGRAWYENGKKKLKVNTFYDFIDVANALIAQGITAPEKMTAIGRSAGGLLMGAIQNMAPQLFRVIVADVPFLDCLNTMLDPTIPLTVLEYQEWGNPQLPEYYQVIRDYAPYEQLDLSRSQGPQPIMLVQAGLKDKRVCYWEPAKYVAKYRHLHRLQRAERHAYQQPFQILLKTDLGAGHFSKTGRYDLLKEYAFEYAFILSQLTPEVLQSTK